MARPRVYALNTYNALYPFPSELQPPEVKNLRRMKTLEGVSGPPRARKRKAAEGGSAAGYTLVVAAGASDDLLQVKSTIKVFYVIKIRGLAIVEARVCTFHLLTAQGAGGNYLQLA